MDEVLQCEIRNVWNVLRQDVWTVAVAVVVAAGDVVVAAGAVVVAKDAGAVPVSQTQTARQDGQWMVLQLVEYIMLPDQLQRHFPLPQSVTLASTLLVKTGPGHPYTLQCLKDCSKSSQHFTDLWSIEDGRFSGFHGVQACCI